MASFATRHLQLAILGMRMVKKNKSFACYRTKIADDYVCIYNVKNNAGYLQQQIPITADPDSTAWYTALTRKADDVIESPLAHNLVTSLCISSTDSIILENGWNHRNIIVPAARATNILFSLYYSLWCMMCS